MNEAAMLLDIIQCYSGAVSSQKHRKDNAKVIKTHISKLKIPRGGGNQLW